MFVYVSSVLSLHLPKLYPPACSVNIVAIHPFQDVYYAMKPGNLESSEQTIFSIWSCYVTFSVGVSAAIISLTF